MDVTEPPESGPAADIEAAGRRVEEAAARLRAQHLRLAEMEHRLKTCVSLIRGWALTLDTAWDNLSDERRQEGITAIRNASEQLADEMVAMLETARVEVGLLEVEPVRLDLNDVLAVTTPGFDGVAGGVRVVHEPGGGEALVEVDPGSLQQVIGHLLENALKYSSGEGQVRVGARREGDEVVLEVSDEGVGIPEGDIFGPFQRGPDTDGLAGTGMGLYVVNSLVSAMGGSVSARRNEGGPGSTFTVRLPAA